MQATILSEQHQHLHSHKSESMVQPDWCFAGVQGALEPEVLNATSAMLKGLLDDLVEPRAREEADQRQSEILPKGNAISS